MAQVVVEPPVYRQCRMCGNDVPHKRITTSLSVHPVVVVVCPRCDHRKCGECESTDGLQVYVPDPLAKRCPRGHYLFGG